MKTRALRQHPNRIHPATGADEGRVILIYNGKNRDPKKGGDPDLANGAYTYEQALFDKTNPVKLLSRLHKPFLKPEKIGRKAGSMWQPPLRRGAGFRQGPFFLYHGCADTFVGAASATNK